MLLKIAYHLNQLFLKNHLIYLAETSYWALVGSWCLELLKWKKIYSRIRSQWHTFYLRVLFCLNANISWDAEHNLLTFNQNDLQMELFLIYVTGKSKRAVAAVAKIVKTWKRQLSRTLDDIRPTLCHISPRKKLLQLFHKLTFRNGLLCRY